MKQTTITLVMFGALFTGSLTAYADSGNPFGFDTNTHPLEYEYCKKAPGLHRGHGYVCSSAPRPHPDLDKYVLQFVENVGLCRITGANEELGKEIKRKLPKVSAELAELDANQGLGNYIWFDILEEKLNPQLTSKYGPPTTTGAKNSGPSWLPKDGFSGLGDVERIRVHIQETRVEVYFGLVTSDACKKKIDEKGKNAF